MPVPIPSLTKKKWTVPTKNTMSFLSLLYISLLQHCWRLHQGLEDRRRGDGRVGDPGGHRQIWDIGAGGGKLPLGDQRLATLPATAGKAENCNCTILRFSMNTAGDTGIDNVPAQKNRYNEQLNSQTTNGAGTDKKGVGRCNFRQVC